MVQDVCIDGGKVRVHIRDYDTDGADSNDPNIYTDGVGGSNPSSPTKVSYENS
jgi:hypothetical protein